MIIWRNSVLCFFSQKSHLVLAIMLILSSNIAIAETRIVTFVGDPWPPYVEGSLGTDAESGIAVEILQEIFSRIGNSEARFPLIPWARALREVEEGNHDGIAMLLKTPEREVYMEFSDPLLMSLNLVWSPTDLTGEAFEWNQISDFEGLRVGVIKGYSYGEALDNKLKSGAINVVTVSAVEHLFAMLANDRIDLALADEAVGAALAKRYPEAKIKSAERPTDSETFYIGISKKSAAMDLLPAINVQIESLHANGVIEQIIRGR